MRLGPNHLVVLDVLLATHSVSETARRLGLTQSAISPATRFSSGSVIACCRRPWGKACVSPWPPPCASSAMSRPPRQAFDPRSIERTYIVAMRDLYIDLFIPQLADALAVNAPRASLKIIPWDTNAIEMQLGTGMADLGIGVDPPNSAQITGRKLFDERFVCIASKGVLKRSLTVQDYADLQHIVVTRTDSVSSPIDKLLAEQGLTRRVIVRTPYFASALALVAQSRMVMTAPERLARRAAQQSDLEIVRLPLDVPKFAVHLIWHERFGHDLLNLWLREQLGSG